FEWQIERVIDPRDALIALKVGKSHQSPFPCFYAAWGGFLCRWPPYHPASLRSNSQAGSSKASRRIVGTIGVNLTTCHPPPVSKTAMPQERGPRFLCRAGGRQQSRRARPLFGTAPRSTRP